LEDIKMELTQKYSVNNFPVEIILNWYKSREIAIPEIQRPFVWDSTQVRNLLDSLYQGFPIGYLIVWRNPNVKLKDGKASEGKKILIDGQQRVMALLTAILGEEIIDKEYKKQRIIISFNPQMGSFEVLNPAIQKSTEWISDISPVIKGEMKLSKVINNYCDNNPSANRDQIEDSLENLKKILSRLIGLIELEQDLDIEAVTEIFTRINSEGVPLSQADFTMSKIASSEMYNGTILRKCIDYFCHLSRYPEFFDSIKENDKEFAESEFFQKTSWLKNETEELYDPSYTDLLRVAFTSEFDRGKLADLVSLLSGRNFETRNYEEEIAKQSFDKLKNGILNFINETNFKRFIMIIKSAGFISPDMIRSMNALDFAYILYLKLRTQKYSPSDIERYVRKWFVSSMLTERYSKSPESQFDFDIKNISNRRFEDFLKDVETAELSDAFWDFSLVQSLKSPVSNSPYFNVFLAAQVKSNNKGFLSRDIAVKELVEQKGDIHHIFPKDYLKSKGLKRNEYNQIANYCYTQSEINIKIGRKSPKEYLSEVFEQCEGGKIKYGGITDEKELLHNLKENCVPEETREMEADRFEEFLEKRRKHMAQKIRKYYKSL